MFKNLLKAMLIILSCDCIFYDVLELYFSWKNSFYISKTAKVQIRLTQRIVVVLCCTACIIFTYDA